MHYLLRRSDILRFWKPNEFKSTGKYTLDFITLRWTDSEPAQRYFKDKKTKCIISKEADKENIGSAQQLKYNKTKRNTNIVKFHLNFGIIN